MLQGMAKPRPYSDLIERLKAVGLRPTRQRLALARLLRDASIIRNRLKVDAVISNAGRVLELRDSHGGFAEWLDAHHPLTKDDWVRLFKKTFRFTGGEITGEFLMSIGYLPGSHDPACPVFDRILRLTPPWTQTTSGGS